MQYSQKEPKINASSLSPADPKKSLEIANGIIRDGVVGKFSLLLKE